MATVVSSPSKSTLKNGSVIEKKDSALNVVLHPLVIINISDQWTRTRVQNNLENPRVFGALVGIQTGRNVEIFNSFELVVENADKQPVIDSKFLVKKTEQFKKVFSTYDFLGWYSTAEGVVPADMDVHRSQTITEFNESPLYLVLDPVACGRKTTKELPISIYESELHIIDDKPTNLFVKVPYKIETGEAERIAVDHVAKITPSGGNSEHSQLSAHLWGLHNAIHMLSMRVKVLLQYLEAAKSGKAPRDHGLLRRVASLSNQLPAIDTQNFKLDFLNEYNDALLIAYLATITKGTNATNDLIDKFNATYERHGARRRGGPFF
eukprot:TRINITY_DN1668_c0_g1_i3.p1 TRINITY_DN1668_c0_g1~~TRINITY_DN1668_c0_g1_i3.p1  ORF type:complete len:322 (-),score=88.50 TRINITY_DN1668_c0_g1_i3:78-1043(-)